MACSARKRQSMLLTLRPTAGTAEASETLPAGWTRASSGKTDRFLTSKKGQGANGVLTDASGNSKHIAYVIIDFDDHLHEYADRYQHQIDNFIAGDPVPGLKVIVFDIKPPFHTASM